MLAMLALTGFTGANGATRVVPYSHLQPDSPELLDPAGSVPAEMTAGSVLLLSGKTVHGGGANTTADEWRSALQVGYVLGWLRSEEAHALAIPATIAAQLPRRAKELFGFAAHDPAPGGCGRLWLVDLDDPGLLLADIPATPAPATPVPAPATPVPAPRAPNLQRAASDPGGGRADREVSGRPRRANPMA